MTDISSPLFPPLFMVAMFARLWYAVPLIVVVSLVYAATRHEVMAPILDHAFKFGTSIVLFMLGVFVVLFAIDWLFL